MGIEVLQEMGAVSKVLWHPEINVTDDFAETIIGKQFSELVPVKIKCIGDGLDNKVLLVNNQFVFKFPHRAAAALIIERERTVLDNLQEFVTLLIPKPIYVGKPCDDYPHHFYGYQIIKGKSVCDVEIDVTSRNASVTKLAEFLKELHSVSGARAHTMGAGKQIFDRADIDKVIISLRKGIGKINAQNIASIDPAVLNEEIKKASSATLSKKKVLVHGDLYCRHLMFDNKNLVGIIDWGQVGVNHPAVDLGIVFSFYDANYHQTFFNIYGTIDSQTYAYARFLGLYSMMMIMFYAHAVNDLQLFQAARESIRRINSKLLEQEK